MTAPEIRSVMNAHHGTWETSTNDEGTLMLDWTPSAEGSVRFARFEVHQGLLVAMRWTLNDLSDQSSMLSEDVLRHVRHDPDGAVNLQIFARSCPLHQHEINRLREDF